jgi:phosphoglucosamine mutase
MAGIVRPSGTQPVIRVTGEGDDPDLIEEIVDGIVEALNKVAVR